MYGRLPHGCVWARCLCELTQWCSCYSVVIQLVVLHGGERKVQSQVSIEGVLIPRQVPSVFSDTPVRVPVCPAARGGATTLPQVVLGCVRV